MNTEFSRVIANEMKTCNESKEYDSITRVHGQIDELKDIMVKNIENVTARGERLELLVNKSENLRDNVSFAFEFVFNNIKFFHNFRLCHSGKHQEP